MGYEARKGFVVVPCTAGRARVAVHLQSQHVLAGNPKSRVPFHYRAPGRRCSAQAGGTRANLQ